ncbi:Psi-producing oxygenase A [Lachnellula hyalina]|uniref:Psi-producing oxygenase A n=1 Tax=Lachnellula hyalina TaxID=1316788 RepID=A0A8H8R1S3_9HELO|nr:Psi-producing oxygenase A [Lachnellula hyalina]TVY26923.1 Psi-producing oxygenase A [Lachnellula hyalina]
MASSPKAPVDTSSTEPKQWRNEIESALKAVKQVIGISLSPIPTQRYIPLNDDNQKMTGLIHDLQKLGFKDVGTLLSLFNSEVKGVQDDNKFLLENLVGVLSKLDLTSKVSSQLTTGFVNNLWNALPHLPPTSLGSKYKYREADGSYNNIRIPELGAANTPYARSAKPKVLQNIALPDPGAIFDSLMVRGETFETHPNKISSMLFYLATVIIHDIFRTDHNDFNNSMTSSYLDLSPLYGSSQEEQNTVRSFKDGKLKPDCFSEKRILGFPPGVGVLVIMFNRFHNYVVTQLALINENGRFSKPKEDATKEIWAKYDNDLFQTGRLITCGLYVNCILKDYVRTILSLNRTGTKWDLDPRASEVKSLFNTPAAEGTGNQVSAEFNLIYRWHSAVSQKDDKWTQDIYTRMFPGKSPEEVTVPELLSALRVMEKDIPEDPLQRPFAGLNRNADGSLDDDALVEIVQSSVEDVAGSFGANRVPKNLRAVEILGIIQARSWNLASLNEFREFTGLTKHATFEDINPDPEVAKKLRNLYEHPDYVELYPGLVAEKAKPPMSPGSGLCVNFTTSYAILSDAVSLVRGDRFYTLDYTPKNLTNWGFNEVQYDLNVSDGAVFHKLFFRAFPNHFKDNSIYAHFPLVVPSENLAILKSLGRADKYSWDKPIRVPELIIIKSYAAVKQILDDKTDWKVTWGEAITFLTSQPKMKNGVDFALAGDNPANADSRRLIIKGLHPDKWQGEVKRFYEETTTKLLKTYSYKVPGATAYQVDIVRDVANLVNTRFAASVFSLPIKTEEHPRGIYTEQELYTVLSILFIVIFNNADIAKSFQLREAGHILAQQLGELILINAEAISKTGIIADLLAKLHESSPLTEYGTHMIQRLLDTNLSVKDVVWSHLLPTAAAMTANQSQIFTQSLDYYLGDGAQYIPELYRLSKENTKEAEDKILRYFMEGARLRATVGVYRSYHPTPPSPTPAIISDAGTKIPIPPGRRVFANIALASLDAAAFPDPLAVRLDRPLDSYLHYGLGPHQCAGMDVSMAAMNAMFKTVFGLRNLRRAVGGGWYGESQGEMKRIAHMGLEGVEGYMTPDQSSYFPFPTTMKVQWDAE